MFTYLKKLLIAPHPHRALAVDFIKKYNIGSYLFRLNKNALERPHYGYIVYNGALLAKKLGHKRVSVLEFGVAGGNGLLNLEYHAKEVKKILDIDIDIYGFDTGEGLPEPEDYRDLPYHWKAGFFKMDVAAIEKKMEFAKLVFGNINETSKTFFEKYDPAPIAAVSHDFDFYSSTATALKMFDADEKYFLPRVFCYFDDTIGYELVPYNDYTGERLAIKEFNEQRETKKLCVPHYLLARAVQQEWHRQIFIYNDFAHRDYNKFISEENQQLPLKVR
jgi:hypothetical protein